MVIFVELFGEFQFSFEGIFLILAMDIVDAIDCALIAGPNTDLFEINLPFSLLLLFVKLD
jgi:hypothetical protein